MSKTNKQYIVDNKGNRTGVIVPIDDYRKMLEDLEELETIRAFDTAKTSGDKEIPYDQAIREIETPESHGMS